MTTKKTSLRVIAGGNKTPATAKKPVSKIVPTPPVPSYQGSGHQTSVGQATPPTNGVNPLTRSAMLVCLAVTQWGNRVKETEINEKIVTEAEADTDMFRTTKKLVSQETISVVSKAFSQYKSFHYENTAPWLDSGYRILPAANFETYMEKTRELKQKAMDAVDEFIKVYPSVRDAAGKKLGKAFKPLDYPSEAELRRRWSINIAVVPIPDKRDFRVDLASDELKRIYENIDEQVKKGMENLTRDLFERLHTVIKTFAERLKEYKVERDKKTGKVTKREKSFRESIVTNIKDLCELLPRMNVTNDAELSRLTSEVAASLGVLDPEVLREDDDVRAKAIKKANAVLKAMEVYVS